MSRTVHSSCLYGHRYQAIPYRCSQEYALPKKPVDACHILWPESMARASTEHQPILQETQPSFVCFRDSTPLIVTVLLPVALALLLCHYHVRTPLFISSKRTLRASFIWRLIIYSFTMRFPSSHSWAALWALSLSNRSNHGYPLWLSFDLFPSWYIYLSFVLVVNSDPRYILPSSLANISPPSTAPVIITSLRNSFGQATSPILLSSWGGAATAFGREASARRHIYFCRTCVLRPSSHVSAKITASSNRLFSILALAWAKVDTPKPVKLKLHIYKRPNRVHCSNLQCQPYENTY